MGLGRPAGLRGIHDETVSRALKAERLDFVAKRDGEVEDGFGDEAG